MAHRLMCLIIVWSTACVTGGSDFDERELSSRAAALVASTPGTIEKVSYASKVLPNVDTHYKIYLPVNYNADPARKFPVTMFLVGSGETGLPSPDGGTSRGDLEAHGPLKTIGSRTPAQLAAIGMDDMIFVVPNHPQYKPSDTNVPLMHEVYEIVMRDYRADPRRFYLTGLSLGGNGTHIFNRDHRTLVAASVVVSAANRRLKSNDDEMTPALACDLYGRGKPVWIIHGAADNMSYGIKVEHAKWLYNVLQECGTPSKSRLSLASRLVNGVVVPYKHSDGIWHTVYANTGAGKWVLTPPGDDALDEPGVGSIYKWLKKFSLDDVPIANVALGKSASASSTSGSYSANLSVDGITSNDSRWMSTDTAGPHVLTIDLGGDFTLTSAVLASGFGSGFAIPRFELQYWNGSQWQPVPGGSVQGNPSSGVRVALTFSSPVVGSRIRLFVPDAGFARVKELEIYGR
jgi:hypothetical protein